MIRVYSMKVKFFEGNIDTIEGDMEHFFSKESKILIKNTSMVAVDGTDIGLPVYCVMIIYE